MPARVERAARAWRAARTSRRHPRRLAEQHRQRHVDRRDRPRAASSTHQPAVAGGVADDGERAALARAQRLELGEALGRDARARSAPALRCTTARAATCPARRSESARSSKRRAAPAVVDQLGQRVRQAAGADVVDREDRVVVAERPAAVDHLLAAPLHLGVVALHRREIEVLVRRARRHRRRRAAAEADQHRRARRARRWRRPAGSRAFLHVLARGCCRGRPASMIGLW